MSRLGEPVVIALGSNLSDPPWQIASAFERLRQLPGSRGWCLSPVYRTPPWGILEQAAFANAIAVAEVDGSPFELMAALRAIESDMGRDRSVPRNGPRIIDLDLICFGQRRLSTNDLIVPHPRAKERGFVLGPWLALVPEAVFPDGLRIADCWAALPAQDRDSIRPWS